MRFHSPNHHHRTTFPLSKHLKLRIKMPGQASKKRRADKKRATRLASGKHTNSSVKTGNFTALSYKGPCSRVPPEPHLKAVALALKHKTRHQSNRWLSYNLGANDVRGCQNELRWGFRWDTPLCERVERERAEARRAAGVGPEAWVDDW